MKIEQFYNKNQFLIKDKKNLYFQSYDSLIAKYNKETGKLTLFKDWDYSNTTRKHLYLFIFDYVQGDISNPIYYAKNKRRAILDLMKQKKIAKGREK